MTNIARMVLVACGGLVLIGCATPNLPDEGLEGAGATESPSPAGAALPPAPSSPAAPAGGSAPAPAPSAPGTPAAVTCNLAMPFGSPAMLSGLAGDDLATPRLSHDELTAYFTTHVNGVARLARAVRPSLAGTFGAPSMIDVQSTSAKDNDPSISADGTTLWFSSERAGSNDKLFMASLVPGAGTFGAPQAVAAVSSSADEQHPYYRVAGGGELWFSSSRAGQWDLYVAKKSGTGFAAPLRVEELHAADGTASRQPMITEDGLTVLFASERAGGAGGRDLWIAKRTSITRAFGAPEAVSAVNSPSDEYAGWLSPDGCRIYFSSDRGSPKQHHVYMASRP